MTNGKMTYEEFIRRLAAIRLRKNLSASELSQTIGKSANYIGRAEAKEFKIPIDILLEILLVCNVTPEEFFYEDFDNYKTDKELFNKINGINKEQREAVLLMLKTFKT